MNVLVFIEHHEHSLHKGSLGVLAKALRIDSAQVSAVLIGDSSVASLPDEVAKFGATRIYTAIGDQFEPPLPQPRMDVIEQIVASRPFDTVLFANSVLAADIAAGLAGRIDAGLNWDLVDVRADGAELIGQRLAISDSVLVEVGWSSPVRIGLFRPGSFDPVETGGVSPQVEEVTWQARAHSGLAKIVEQELESSAGPSLEDAEIIVSGGMGLGSKENFSLVETLAEALGGAVGATRAVVYARWYPQSAQVGQTGNTVSPKLYIALGISGATQHKVGMQSSKAIVAVNTDPNAPIFDFSDLGIVGDVNAVVPALTELIRQHKSS